MAGVYTGASMSLDGYISGPGESGFEYLFEWYNAGDVALTTDNPDVNVKLTETDHAHFRRINEMTGAIVVGRKLFDFTNGWGGSHPLGVPVVVLTHTVPDGWPREGKKFTFVTEGIERAIEVAKELAGDKIVGLNGGTIASQALNAGLLDEVWVDLVPVLLGGGTRFFDALDGTPVVLDGPLEATQGTRVTHLRFRVRR